MPSSLEWLSAARLALCSALLCLACSQSPQPTAHGKWHPSGSLDIARSFHTATLLPSGQVFVSALGRCSRPGAFSCSPHPRDRRNRQDSSDPHRRLQRPPSLPILLGATLGYWAVRAAPPVYKAHKANEKDSRPATSLLVGGFALFSLLSAYLG